MKIYLGLPNYTNNLAPIGFTPEDWADGGSDRLVDAITCWGSVDKIVARVAEHHAAGADHVCIQVLRADNEFPRAEWKLLADALP